MDPTLTLTINDEETRLLAQLLLKRQKELAEQPQTEARDEEFLLIRQLVQRLRALTIQLLETEQQRKRDERN